jgi:nucleotide-binding universal stress UspA family protein
MTRAKHEEYRMSENMKVLIAYDGSSCADVALDDLRCAGLPPVAEALIMSVADVFLPPPSSQEAACPARVPVAVQQAWARATHAVEEAQTLAQRAQAQVLTYFPTWDVRAEACADAPAWAVIKQADTWQPDVVVVGSHGRSAVSRLLLGSVSQKILTEAQCSVRVGRSRRQTEATAVRLLIGVDGSPDAAAAVQVVAARAWPTGSEARLVAVLDARMRTALAPARPPVETWSTVGDADEQAWVPKMVDAMAELLRTRGLNVSSVINEGDPKQVLLDEAEHWGADCLFVGARGLSRIERFLLGSVSAAVAARAHCSVEVVRPRRTS